MTTQLTSAGREWAERNAAESVVANVALHGDGWPAPHVETARVTANEEGAKLSEPAPQPGQTVEFIRGAAEWIGKRGVVIETLPRQVVVDFPSGREVVSIPAVKVIKPARGPVELSTAQYEFAHGRKPRGTGQWAFFFDGQTEPYWGYGSYAKCSGDARKLAVANGFTRIEVGS